MLLRSETAELNALIDLTPVIDMVFMLLVFFLVATTIQQSEREMKIALPQAGASGPISAALKEIVVNVDERGGVFVSGQAVTDEALFAMVKGAVGAHGEQKVSVRGDRATMYANVTRVLDVCKAAGVAEPYLETVPGPGVRGVP